MRAATTSILSILTVLPFLGCDPMAGSEERIDARSGEHGDITVPLVVGDDPIGAVRAWRAADEVCIELTTRPGWHITTTDLEIHAESDTTPDSADDFAYHHDGLWTTTDLHCVALDEVGGAAGESLVIAAHATVTQGEQDAAKSLDAWSQGPDPDRDPTFGLGSTPNQPRACGHTTHTQSQWGAVCSAGNAGCFRDKHFMTAFPEGLIVGCGVLTANLVTPKAVEYALPSAGLPRPLLQWEAVAYDGNGDPKVGTAFFGQVVALGLNIGLDAYSSDPDADPPLEQLVITDATSPCLGMSVAEVNEQANLALGNCPATHSPLVLNECVQTINKAFASGEECSASLGLAPPPPQ